MKEDTQNSLVGTIIGGRYQITECLAKGGMGVVFKGEQLQLNRPVAIKFLQKSLSDSPEFKGRFEREAKAMSQLSHPNVVSVIDFGVDESPFIVMDFVTGETLRQILDEDPVDIGRAVHIIKQLLAALAHAHKQGIIHRDIKPDNIMLSEATGMGDHVRIFDFGLAKLMEPGPENNLSRTDMAMGTPNYMSPEQTLGNPADVRSDLYSTGIVLFELLTGRKPFIEENPFKVMQMHRDKAPPMLNEVGSGKVFSREMELVISKALEKEPARRFPSAMAFAEALAAAPESRLAPIAFETTPDAGLPTTRTDLMSPRRPNVASSDSAREKPRIPSSADDRPSESHEQISWPPEVREDARRGPFVSVAVIFLVLGALGLGFGFRDKLSGVLFAAKGEVDTNLNHLAVRIEGATSNVTSGFKAFSERENKDSLKDLPFPRPTPLENNEVSTQENSTLVDTLLSSDEDARDSSSPEVDYEGEDRQIAEAPPVAEPLDNADHLNLEKPMILGAWLFFNNDTGAKDKDAGLDSADSEATTIEQLIQAEQYDEALEALRTARQENPNRAVYPYLMAGVFFKKRWLKDSLEHYRDAMKLNPGLRNRSTLNENLIAMLEFDPISAKARVAIVDQVGRTALPYLRRAAKHDSSPKVRKRAASIAATLSKAKSKNLLKAKAKPKSRSTSKSRSKKR